MTLSLLFALSYLVFLICHAGQLQVPLNSIANLIPASAEAEESPADGPPIQSSGELTRKDGVPKSAACVKGKNECGPGRKCKELSFKKGSFVCTTTGTGAKPQSG